jgi:hypothetical protein
MASPAGQQGPNFKSGDKITHEFLDQVVIGLARRVVGEVGIRVRRLGTNLLIGKDEIVGGGQEWFWARLTSVPSLIYLSPLDWGVDAETVYGLAYELKGWRFTYPFQEVTLVADNTEYDEETNEIIGHAPAQELVLNGITGDALNTVEFQHYPYPVGGGDQIPWMVYGVNILGTYYPPDFRPIMPGTYYNFTDDPEDGRKYHSLYEEFGSQAAPVVRMRHTVDKNGNNLYEFTRPGSHDGGCAIIS